MRRKRLARTVLPEVLETRCLLSVVTGDFNNDGFEDLAVGVPGDRFWPAGDRGRSAGRYHS